MFPMPVAQCLQCLLLFTCIFVFISPPNCSGNIIQSVIPVVLIRNDYYEYILCTVPQRIMQILIFPVTSPERCRFFQLVLVSDSHCRLGMIVAFLTNPLPTVSHLKDYLDVSTLEFIQWVLQKFVTRGVLILRVYVGSQNFLLPYFATEKSSVTHIVIKLPRRLLRFTR